MLILLDFSEDFGNARATSYGLMKIPSENEDANKSVPHGSRNISQERRNRLISKIEEIDRVNPEDRIDEIKKSLTERAEHNDNDAQRLLKYIKTLEDREGDLRRVLQRELRATRYGLVFEEHREDIEDKLESNLPVLVEKKERLIDNGGPVNFLLEGDNLASLQLLARTHKEKIDFIYIDPPYNTGNKDFRYNDDYVEKTDTFRHSKWLSFMSKRLKIAKKLLSSEGLIFISINNIEVGQLKILSDSIFGESNYVTTLIWKCRASLYYTEPLFSEATENILVYAKDKSQFWLKAFDKESLEEGKKLEGFFLKRVKKKYDAEGYKNPDNDPNGPYKTSGKVRNDNRPSYTVTSPTGVSHTEKWVYKPDVFEKLDKLGMIYWGKDGSAQPRKKSYLKDFIGNVSSNLLSDEIARIEKKDGTIKKEKYFEIGTTESGKEELKDILGKDVEFEYPKPTTLIKYLIERYPKDDITILDFFAGTGTTGHAVMRLNKEDGGKRRFILCTDNETRNGNEEDGICRKITHERLKRVIERENYEATLKYFQIDFVPIMEKQEADLRPLLYEEYEGELLLPACVLVELENAINFTGNAEVAIIQTQKEFDSFISSLGKNNRCRVVYVGLNVSLGGKKKELLARRNIKVKKIPDCYYRDFSR